MTNSSQYLPDEGTEDETEDVVVGVIPVIRQSITCFQPLRHCFFHLVYNWLKVGEKNSSIVSRIPHGAIISK